MLARRASKKGFWPFSYLGRRYTGIVWNTFGAKIKLMWQEQLVDPPIYPQMTVLAIICSQLMHNLYRRLSRNMPARGSSTSHKAGGPTKV